MFDFHGFFMMISHVAIILSGGAVLLTPAVMAIAYDWRSMYLYVPIAVAFWLGALAVKPREIEEEVYEDEDN